jgi:phosphoribosylformimino-5-aminoimidazole carboxamide ribotide isomerase
MIRIPFPVRQRFSVIPVLDLKRGEVVHARAGERAQYRPIRSNLTASSAPGTVVAGLMSLAPFGALYIADLDAIAGEGDHRALIAALVRRHAGLEVWLDGGIATASEAVALAGVGVVPVIGSETLQAAGELGAAVAALGPGRVILSLDYRGEHFMGPPAIAETVDLWPDRVIVMTLARVGTGVGPDIERLRPIVAGAGEREIYAAGGVRDRADLGALAEIGCAGVLVASALHDGRLTPADLTGFV